MTLLSYENTSRTVETARGTLHYHEAGEGPPLLLLHGSGPGVTGWTNFQGNIAFFAERFRTFVLDLPGYGQSPPVEGHPVMATIDSVLAFMDAMGIERADIIGNSFGGMVGGQIAARSPERVRRFVSIGGIGVYTLSSFPSEGLTRLVEFVENPTREMLTAWMRSMVFDPATLTEEMIDERFRSAHDPVVMATSRKVYSREAFNAIAAATRGPNATDAFSHLTSINAPTLLAWGRDDKVTPLDGSLLPMRLIPNCELHVFPNCGHWAMIERKTEFESAVMAFLTRPDA